jgi:isoleucyl-tRNA synthetase
MPDAPAARDYRSTLNLPTTDFPMRAELPKREPERVRWWAERRTYLTRLERNRAAGAPPFILHDGPPYANNDLHMGTFLNRFLKDALVKIHLLDGKVADFVPGWDMHGLPIERETLLHLKLDFRVADPIALRRACRERALYWLDRQRDQMLRIGASFGHFDDPYMTIAPSFEATIVETLADLAERDYLYKGLRSTLWCVHDETALAEAEIEYKDHTSPSIYVRFRATTRSVPRCWHGSDSMTTARRCRSRSGRRRPGRCRPTSRSRSSPTPSTASIGWAARTSSSRARWPTR